MNFTTIFKSKRQDLPVDSATTSFCACCGVDVAQFR